MSRESSKEISDVSYSQAKKVYNISKRNEIPVEIFVGVCKIIRKDGKYLQMYYTLLESNKYSNSVAWESTKLVPTFADREVSRSQRRGSLAVVISVSRLEPLLSLSSSSSFVLTWLSGPRSRPADSQKIWYLLQWNPDLWICSQKLWPLDHRGRHIVLIGIT
jgi:hypothetical protein